MPRKIFINLPVKDLQRSIAFFKELGYTFNAQYSNDKGGCMVVSEDIYVMLLSEAFFLTFISGAVSDTSKGAEVILSLDADSRADVDALLEKALAAGATSPLPAQDHGFMYQRGFRDLDGHHWEVFWMDQQQVKES